MMSHNSGRCSPAHCLLSLLTFIAVGCASQSEPAPSARQGKLVVARSLATNDASAQASAISEFDQLRTIFLEQCTFRVAKTVAEQVKCTQETFRRSSPQSASLKLFDSIAARFLSTPFLPQYNYEKRMEFVESLARVQRALESGDTVDEPLDELMENVAIKGAQSMRSNSTAPSRAGVIPLNRQGATYSVPVSINGRLTLDFTLDTGASDVSIPADVALTLMRTGTLQPQDFIGQQIFRLADGSQLPSQTVRIHTLKVGAVEVHDVKASIVPANADLLLGQSFLGRLKSWTLDNERPALVVTQ